MPEPAEIDAGGEIDAIWCLGLYASASTWLFNALLKISEALHPDRSIASRFVASANDLTFAPPPLALKIIKSHETDLAAADALDCRMDVILVSIRDPRDAVASLMTYHAMGFDNAARLVDEAARLCGRFARDPRCLMLRYEDGFFDDPCTLDLVAERMRGRLAVSDRTRIFAETRRPAIETYIGEVPNLRTTLWRRESGDFVDPVTHWHRHHTGRTGEIGRWRRVLSPDQAAAVEALLSDWIADHGYV